MGCKGLFLLAFFLGLGLGLLGLLVVRGRLLMNLFGRSFLDVLLFRLHLYHRGAFGIGTLDSLLGFFDVSTVGETLQVDFVVLEAVAFLDQFKDTRFGFFAESSIRIVVQVTEVGLEGVLCLDLAELVVFGEHSKSQSAG